MEPINANATKAPTTNVSKPDYVDALNEYYRYKHDYDERYEEHRNAIKESTMLTMQQKRAKIMQLKRNRKCVACGQSGGTHFTNEDGMLRAQCGNRSQPCSLRIEIVKGKFMSLEELANASLHNADVLKDHIIKTKLDLLFNYTTEEEALRKFETDRAALDQALDLYGGFRQKYLDVVRNPERREEAEALTAEFYAAVQEFKEMVKMGADSNTASFIRDAVAHYIGKIEPLNNKLMETKYVYSAMEHDHGCRASRWRRETDNCANGWRASAKIISPLTFLTGPRTRRESRATCMKWRTWMIPKPARTSSLNSLWIMACPPPNTEKRTERRPDPRWINPSEKYNM